MAEGSRLLDVKAGNSGCKAQSGYVRCQGCDSKQAERSTDSSTIFLRCGIEALGPDPALNSLQADVSPSCGVCTHCKQRDWALSQERSLGLFCIKLCNFESYYLSFIFTLYPQASHRGVMLQSKLHHCRLCFASQKAQMHKQVTPG